MSTDHLAFPTDLAAAVVRRKAKTLVGKAGFGLSDIGDIQQELLTDLLARWPKYDPAKGEPGAFLASLVEHLITSILRYRSAKRRHYRRCRVSLNSFVSDPNGRGIELGQTLSSRQKQRAEAKQEGDAHRASDLRTDIDSVLAQLPPKLGPSANSSRISQREQLLRNWVRAAGKSKSKFRRFGHILSEPDCTIISKTGNRPAASLCLA